MLSNFVCSKDWIMQDLPNQIWEAQALAGKDSYTWVTRLFHNKPIMYSTNFLRCELYHLAPDYIARKLTFIGLFFWLIAIFHLVKNRRYFGLIIIIFSSGLVVFQIPVFKLVAETIFTIIQGSLSLYGVFISVKYLITRKQNHG